MSTGEIIGLVSLILTNFGINLGIYKYFTDKISEYDKTNEIRVARVYERLDEVKLGTENTYVRKDSCMLLHNNTADNLKNVELRMLAQFEKIDKKLDDFLKMLIDKK